MDHPALWIVQKPLEEYLFNKIQQNVLTATTIEGVFSGKKKSGKLLA